MKLHNANDGTITDHWGMACMLAVWWFLSSSVVVICRTWEKYLSYMVRWFYGTRPVICCILHLFTEHLISVTYHRDYRTSLKCFSSLWRLENYCFILLKLIEYVVNKHLNILTWIYLVIWNLTVAWKLCDLGKLYLQNFSNFLVTTRTEEKIPCHHLCFIESFRI